MPQFKNLEPWALCLEYQPPSCSKLIVYLSFGVKNGNSNLQVASLYICYSFGTKTFKAPDNKTPNCKSNNLVDFD